MMTSSLYSTLNEVVAAPCSLSNDAKHFPPFSRLVSSAVHKPYHADSKDSHKKQAALDGVAEFPPGVTSIDVLCGRDKVSHAHIGNKHFRRIIETFREGYQKADCRDQKTNITCSVIARIHSYGGRFLKLNEDTGIWEEVGDQYAREKVSHALRSAKDPNRPKVKKPRKIKKYVPSHEEDAAFREALEEQQRIFQNLIDNHVESGATEEDDCGDCGDLKLASVDEEEDWDFYQ
jgi:hypothetical protein